MIGSSAIGANPRALEWGTAPCLIRSTTRAGTITVRARPVFEGIHTPAAGELSFESTPAVNRLLFSEVGATHPTSSPPAGHKGSQTWDVDVDAVGAQQTEFELPQR